MVDNPSVLASVSDILLLHAPEQAERIGEKKDIELKGEVLTATWSHNNSILAITYAEDPAIYLLDPNADCALIQAFPVVAEGVKILCLSFSHDSTFLAFGCEDGLVGILNLRLKEIVERFPAESEVRAISYNN